MLKTIVNSLRVGVARALQAERALLPLEQVGSFSALGLDRSPPPGATPARGASAPILTWLGG